MTVRNMEGRSGKVANQFIITGEGKTTFQSYDSTIAEIDDKKMEITIHPNYNYSKTTGKYRNQFFEQEGFSGLATLKDLEKAIENGGYNGWKVKMAS